MRVYSRVLADGAHRIVVEDDGVGWDGAGPAKGTGLGAKILKAMSRTLDAQLIYEPIARGTRVAIMFAPGERTATKAQTPRADAEG